MLDRRTLLAASAASAAASLPWAGARAQGSGLKIGVLGDQSGVYRDLSGPVAIASVKQAIEEMQPHLSGVTVDVVGRRPPEQAGRRRLHRARVVRP